MDNKNHAKKIQEFNSIQSISIFRKFWARKKYVKTFDVKYGCWASYYKKKILLKKIWLKKNEKTNFLSAAQSLIPSS